MSSVSAYFSYSLHFLSYHSILGSSCSFLFIQSPISVSVQFLCSLLYLQFTWANSLSHHSLFISPCWVPQFFLFLFWQSMLLACQWACQQERERVEVERTHGLNEVSVASNRTMIRYMLWNHILRGGANKPADSNVTSRVPVAVAAKKELPIAGGAQAVSLSVAIAAKKTKTPLYSDGKSVSISLMKELITMTCTCAF